MAKHAVHKTRTLAENGINRAIENLDKAQVDQWLDTLGAVKDKDGNIIKRGVESPELVEARRQNAYRAIDNRQVSLFKAEINAATSPEAVDKVWERAKSGGTLAGVSKYDREAFDIFALAAKNDATKREKIEKKQAATEAKSALKEANDASALEVKGLKANIGLAEKESERLGRMCIDEKGATARLDEILAASNFTDDEKAIARNEVLETLKDAQVSAQKGIQAKFRKQAFDALDVAQKNNGFIDSDTLKDGKLSKARREAAAIGNYENMTPEQKSDFSRAFFSLLLEANSYSAKVDTDASGEKLTDLMRRAQAFPEKHRVQLMNAIYDSAHGLTPNEKWSTEDSKQFKEEFANVCKLNDGRGFLWRGEAADPIAYLDLQTRVMHLAKMRGLSLNETLKEMKEDPFYKDIMLKANKEKALKFINR